VKALRQESEAALPSEELLTTPDVPERLPELVEPAKAAWVEALRQESEAALPSEQLLTTPDVPEELTAEVKAIDIQKKIWDRSNDARSSGPVALRLGKEWRAALRAEMEELLAKREEAPIETTVIPLPAEAAWASALREETQEQLEKLSIATSPWAIALRGATEEQLERLSAADTAWASSLRDDSQRQLEQISAGRTAWAIALRRSTSEELSSLSAAETAWVKGLRHLTGQQLLTLSSAGSPWAKKLHQETKNLLRRIDEGKQGWISSLQDDSLYALNAYEEAHRPPDITAPVDPPQSDFIASLMAAAEKVTADEDPLSEVAEDFWDDIALEDSESQPEPFFGKAEERAINEPIAPPIAPPVKDEPKAREERFTQPPSRSERVAKEEWVPQKEAKPTAARPAPAKEPPIKERKADKVPVVEEKVSAVPDPSDEWRTARWLWQTKQDKEALAIYQRIFDERQAPNEKLAEELSAWTKPGNASALAYQLLGDLYRRMGRMQDAVAQYREAINRM
jgi:tetratricopeptide (TPR) repeat protein